MSEKDNLFSQIDSAVLDLQASGFQTFHRPIKRLAQLLHHLDLHAINEELTANIDLDAFLRASYQTGASFVGSQRLLWPDDIQQQLGLFIGIVDKLAADENFAISFAHQFYYSGNKVIADINAMTRGLIIPFTRDYKRFALAQSRSEAAQNGKIMKDFFVSYTHVDKAWAEWIAWQLEEAGYTTVIQAWDFLPGANFVLQMQSAAATADRTIAVLSQKYLESAFTAPEWAAAFAQDPKGTKQKLIPIRVGRCDLTGILAPIIYLDLVGVPEKDAQAALLGAFRIRNKPSSAPVFPGSPTTKISTDTSTSPVYPGATETAPIAEILPSIAEKADHTRHLSAMQRIQFMRQLNEILPQQFNLLLFSINPPAGLIPPMPAPQADRVSTLLSWAEGTGGCGLALIQEVLETVANLQVGSAAANHVEGVVSPVLGRRTSGDSVVPAPPHRTSRPLVAALEWNNHLGHQYQAVGNAIYTIGITFSGKNISDKPVQLQSAKIISGIIGASADMVVETIDGSQDPSDSDPISPNALVTLKTEFSGPTGLLAQEFINSWGLMYLSLIYDGEPHEVKITEQMSRKLYESFRPYPLIPETTVVEAVTWSKDGTLGKSTKGDGYYKIRKEYVEEPGVEEDRFKVYYQPRTYSFEENGQFILVCHQHGFKTLEEAQFASERSAVVTAKHLGL